MSDVEIHEQRAARGREIIAQVRELEAQDKARYEAFAATIESQNKKYVHRRDPAAAMVAAAINAPFSGVMLRRSNCPFVVISQAWLTGLTKDRSAHSSQRGSGEPGICLPRDPASNGRDGDSLSNMAKAAPNSCGQQRANESAAQARSGPLMERGGTISAIGQSSRDKELKSYHGALCALCGATITSENDSEEHLFPSAPPRSERGVWFPLPRLQQRGWRQPGRSLPSGPRRAETESVVHPAPLQGVRARL